MAWFRCWCWLSSSSIEWRKLSSSHARWPFSPNRDAKELAFQANTNKDQETIYRNHQKSRQFQLPSWNHHSFYPSKIFPFLHVELLNINGQQPGPCTFVQWSFKAVDQKVRTVKASACKRFFYRQIEEPVSFSNVFNNMLINSFPLDWESSTILNSIPSIFVQKHLEFSITQLLCDHYLAEMWPSWDFFGGDMTTSSSHQERVGLHNAIFNEKCCAHLPRWDDEIQDHDLSIQKPLRWSEPSLKWQISTYRTYVIWVIDVSRK